MENGNVGAILDATVQWGTSSLHGLELYEKPVNSWCRAAHILHAGNSYE